MSCWRHRQGLAAPGRESRWRFRRQPFPIWISCAERGQYRPQVVEAAVEQIYLAEGGAGRREAYSQYLEAKRRLLRPEAPPGESPPGEESLLRELTECREQLALYDLLLGYKEETVSLQAVTIDVLQGKIRKLEAQAENRRAAGFTEKCV